MSTSLVMTIIGRDRPGLVETVADLVARHEGNWLESRMAHLGGQFAGILRVQVPTSKHAALTRELQALQGQGLTVVVQPDKAPSITAEKRLIRLEVVGQDRPGIVRQISGALAERGVNVEEFSSECVSAPMSGDTLFRAQARLHVPESCPREELRQVLERIAGDLIVDVTFAELSGETAQ